MIYVGIDVAKDKQECIIITEENKIVTPCFSFSNTREGFQRLDREIRNTSQIFSKRLKELMDLEGCSIRAL